MASQSAKLDIMEELLTASKTGGIEALEQVINCYNQLKTIPAFCISDAVLQIAKHYRTAGEFIQEYELCQWIATQSIFDRDKDMFVNRAGECYDYIDFYANELDKVDFTGIKCYEVDVLKFDNNNPIKINFIRNILANKHLYAK